MLTGPLTSLLYSLTTMVVLMGYLPQIVALCAAGEKDRRISVSTLGIWLAGWVFCLAYGITVVQDWRFSAIALINVAGHAAFIGLILFKRHVRLARAKPVS